MCFLYTGRAANISTRGQLILKFKGHVLASVFQNMLTNYMEFITVSRQHDAHTLQETILEICLHEQTYGRPSVTEVLYWTEHFKSWDAVDTKPFNVILEWRKCYINYHLFIC